MRYIEGETLAAKLCKARGASQDSIDDIPGRALRRIRPRQTVTSRSEGRLQAPTQRGKIDGGLSSILSGPRRHSTPPTREGWSIAISSQATHDHDGWRPRDPRFWPGANRGRNKRASRRTIRWVRATRRARRPTCPPSKSLKPAAERSSGRHSSGEKGAGRSAQRHLLSRCHALREPDPRASFSGEDDGKRSRSPRSSIRSRRIPGRSTEDPVNAQGGCRESPRKGCRQRYGTALKLAEDLGGSAAPEPISYHPQEALRPVTGLRQKKPVGALLIAVLFLGLSVSSGWRWFLAFKWADSSDLRRFR